MLTGGAHLPALTAFLLAYPPSLLWNTALNRAWTFADQRHGLGEGTARYLERALLSGAAMFAVYAALVGLRAAPVAAAAGGAVVAMAVNGVANRAAVRRRPRLWSEVALNQGVQAVLGGSPPRSARRGPRSCPPRGRFPPGFPPGWSSAPSRNVAGCCSPRPPATGRSGVPTSR